MNKWLIWFLLLLFSQHTFATEPFVFQSSLEENRFNTLTQELRCVVCQGESLADSNAPLANDLRAKVYQLIQQQKSNAEIKNYLVKRYGEFILLKPKFTAITLLLWLFPVFSSIGIGFYLRRIMSS